MLPKINFDLRGQEKVQEEKLPSAAVPADTSMPHPASPQPLPADLIQNLDVLEKHLQCPQNELFSKLDPINQALQKNPESLTRLTDAHLKELAKVFQALYNQHSSSRLSLTRYFPEKNSLEACLTSLVTSISQAEKSKKEANALTKEGTPKIIDAILKNDFHLVAHLLKKGADLNTKILDHNDFYFGLTLPQLAVEKGNTKILKLLMESGAQFDPNTPWSGNMHPPCTPTQLAVYYTNLELLKFLIDQGAQFNPNTPLHSAFPGPLLPVEVAVKNQNTGFLKFLIEKGLDVNTTLTNKATTGYSGYTLAQIAVEENDPDLLALLISKNANLNPRLPKTHPAAAGYTLAELAILHDNAKILEFMINKGIVTINDKLPNDAAHPNQTLTEVALTKNSKKVLQLLKERSLP